MWHCKLVLGNESIEPNRYHAGCVPHYTGWLEDDHNGLGHPGFVHCHRIIDEKTEAQVKDNQQCKRMRECENEHREIQEAHEKLINEWKDMAVNANNRMGYLERGLVELDGKFLKRIEDCKNAEGSAGGHLARAYLLLGLCELMQLYEGGKCTESGEGLSGTK